MSQCTLSDIELVSAVRKWNERLCESRGEAWVLRIPVDGNKDPDILMETLCERFENTLGSEK